MFSEAPLLSIQLVPLRSTLTKICVLSFFVFFQSGMYSRLSYSAWKTTFPTRPLHEIYPTIKHRRAYAAEDPSFQVSWLRSSTDNRWVPSHCNPLRYLTSSYLLLNYIVEFSPKALHNTTEQKQVAYHVPRGDDEKQITNDKKLYILQFLERQWAVRTEVETESRVDSPKIKKNIKADVMKKRASSDASSISSHPNSRRLS